MKDPREAARHSMVNEQLERRGIHDARVLDAFRRVPREAFVTSYTQTVPLPSDMVSSWAVSAFMATMKSISFLRGRKGTTR